MKVYISSSWKNRDRVRAFANALRTAGHLPYDFTDPATRKTPEIPPERFPEAFDPEKHKYREYLDVPEWRVAVAANREALNDCDACVLLLPCGHDAHADWAYAVARGKRTAVVGQPRAGERTPTHWWADVILDADEDAVSWCNVFRESSGRVGDWIQSFSGKQMWPLDPREEEICIDDIAHHLSLQCRFTGAVQKFYSVGEHSVRVSCAVPEEDALDGLLHDAAEAYLVDLCTPIKNYSALGDEYRKIEAGLERVIRKKFCLRPEMPPSVREADARLLVTEMRDLMSRPPAARKAAWQYAPLEEKIIPWSPADAELRFLARFNYLTIAEVKDNRWRR